MVTFSRSVRDSATAVLCLAAFVMAIAAFSKLREGPPAPGLTSTAVGDRGELLLVFIGSSTCGASEAPGFPEALATVQTALGERAAAFGLSFGTLGVAIDHSPRKGIAFLESMGDFDELIAGRGWINQGGVSFVWRHLPGESAIPQIVVLARNVSTQPASSHYLIGADHLVARIVGIEEFFRWASHDAPTPRLSDDFVQDLQAEWDS